MANFVRCNSKMNEDEAVNLDLVICIDKKTQDEHYGGDKIHLIRFRINQYYTIDWKYPKDKKAERDAAFNNIVGK